MIIKSSSKGNAYLYPIDEQNIVLVDCGIPFSTLRNALLELGYSVERLTHIFYTHEHCDHFIESTLQQIVKVNRNVKIFAPEGVWFKSKANMTNISNNSNFKLKSGLQVKLFPIVHDVEGLGFLFNEKILHITDTGDINHVINYIGSNKIILDYAGIECNYDEDTINKNISLSEVNGEIKRLIRVKETHLSESQWEQFELLCKPKKIEKLHVSSRNYGGEL